MPKGPGGGEPLSKAQDEESTVWELPEGWAAVRMSDLPGTYRFFARIRTLDFACPRCGEIYLVRRHRQGKHRVVVYSGNRHKASAAWDPVLQRLTCRICHLTVVLGVMAYPVSRARPVPPEDAVATMAEALRIRAARLGGEWVPSERAGKGMRVNRLVRVKDSEVKN